MEKIRISYTDANDKEHHPSILPEQLKYYDRWREIKEIVESGRLKEEKALRARENMEKCIKLFTYQKTKDERIECECGISVIRCQMARHRATSKHTKQLEALNIEEKPKEPFVMADTDKMCECGHIVSKANYARHIEGNRHAKYMLIKK